MDASTSGYLGDLRLIFLPCPLQATYPARRNIPGASLSCTKSSWWEGSIYIYIYTHICIYRERERVMFFALNRPGKKKGKQPYQIVMQWICCVGVNPFGTHKSCGKGHATPIQKTCWKVGQLSFLPLNENKSWSVKKFQSPFLHSFQSSFRIPLNYSLLFILQYHQGQPLHGDSLEDPHVEQEFRVWSFTFCLRYKGLAGDRVWNNWTYRCMKKGMNHEARYQQKNP